MIDLIRLIRRRLFVLITLSITFHVVIIRRVDLKKIKRYNSTLDKIVKFILELKR